MPSHTINFSHLDKLYYPASHLTKGDVIDYYRAIAPYFLALNSGRPIVMHRFPDGIAHEGFYQKQISDYFSAWVERKKILLKKGTTQELVVINDQDSLLYLANQGVLVFHAWLSPVSSVRYPDKMVFDLDPSGNDLQELRFGARQLKKMLEKHGLTPFLMTTGSHGYHVVVPLVAQYSFAKIHAFAKKIADELVEQYPDLFTTHISKKKRKGRIFIDYLRNAYGQTSVAPYSLRALEGAPVATPIGWSELSRTEPQKYTLNNIFKRLKRVKDPWKNFFKKACRLKL